MELRGGGVALMIGLIGRHEEGVFHGIFETEKREAPVQS
jgi:hypothetical protein